MLFRGWGTWFQLQCDPGIESIWKNAASMGHWKLFWHWATWLSSPGSLFGGGWNETSYGVSLHQGLSCHFMLLLVCLHLFKDALRQGDLNSNSTIFPGNLGNIFRSCLGLSLSSTLFTPFHHLKPPNRRLEHFHPILSGVHHLSSPQGRKSTWMYCTVFMYVNICKYTCICSNWWFQPIWKIWVKWDHFHLKGSK